MQVSWRSEQTRSTSSSPRLPVLTTHTVLPGAVNLWALFPRTYFFLPDTFSRKTFSDRLRTPPLSCAENLLWSMDSLDVTHKKGRFSTRWRTSHAPASQARDSTRPRGARARRARRRRGLGPVWRNSTRGAARASQHTRSRPAATPQHVQINGDSTPGSLRVGRARGAAEGSQQGRVAAQVHDGCAVRRGAPPAPWTYRLAQGWLGYYI